MKLIIQNNRIAATATDDYAGPDDSIDAPADFDIERINDYRIVDGELVIPPARVLTKLQFIDRFTDDEIAAIYAAAKESVQVEIWLERFKLSSEVDLDDPRTISGVQALEVAGLIAQGRAQVILQPPSSSPSSTAATDSGAATAASTVAVPDATQGQDPAAQSTETVSGGQAPDATTSASNPVQPDSNSPATTEIVTGTTAMNTIETGTTAMNVVTDNAAQATTDQSAPAQPAADQSDPAQAAPAQATTDQTQVTPAQTATGQAAADQAATGQSATGQSATGQVSAATPTPSSGELK